VLQAPAAGSGRLPRYGVADFSCSFRFAPGMERVLRGSARQIGFDGFHIEGL